MKPFNNRFHYYVEGKCEKKLVRILIDQHLIIPGQTDVLNPVQELIKATHLRSLPKKTNIVLIFDTDTPEIAILRKNIAFLKSRINVQNVYIIPQIRNLEEELVRCTNIRYVRELLNCNHDSDFKTAFIEEKRLFEKLQAHDFDIKKLWSTQPIKPLLDLGIENQGDSIKL